MSDCTYIVTSEDLEKFAAALGICLDYQAHEQVEKLNQALSALGSFLGNAFAQVVNAVADYMETFWPDMEAAIQEALKPTPKTKRPDYKATPRYDYKMDYRSHIYKINYAYRKE